MANTAFKTYAKDYGGRVVILFLLFLLAIFQLINSGFNAFAIVCAIPLLVVMVVMGFQRQTFTFWVLIVFNFCAQWKDFPSTGLPMSVPSEMLEILLIVLALINVQEYKFTRLGNVMLLALTIWSGYCFIELFNDTCDLGIQPGAWFTGARMMAYQLVYAFVVFVIYINNPKMLVKYLYVWGAITLFATFWIFKQKYIGLTPADSSFLYGRGRTTHLLQGGTLIRYWSIYSDAANFGIGIAATAVAFIIFAMTSKVKKHRRFFGIVAAAAVWGMFPSGTRTAIVCLFAGIMAYVFLSKSFKIAIPVTLLGALMGFLLVFTTVGNGNQQIRRMRSAFNKNDASANQRAINQEVMKKYLAEAPFGIGLGIGYDNVPANNKYRKMATIAPDSEYVYIWIHTGEVGLTIFLITTAIMFLGASRIVFFKLQSPSLRGIGAGLCCAFVSIQLGGYGNQVLMQFPNCLVFYGGLSLVYVLPHIEEEWIAYEGELLAEQERKERKERRSIGV